MEQACIDEATALDDAVARRPLSALFFAGGGALLVTGIVLLIVGPDADKYTPSSDAGDELAHVQPIIAPATDGGMLGMRASF